MANPQKQKGDKAERDAVVDITALVPDLVRAKPERYLGAGRKDDVGDVRVLDDVAIQVKNFADPSTAVSEAVKGSQRQREHKEASEGWAVPFHLGMIQFPRARPGTVKWIAVGGNLPDIDPDVSPVVVSTYKMAIALVRLNPGKTFYVPGSGRSPEAYFTSLDTWLALYRVNRRHIADNVDEFREFWSSDLTWRR